MPLFRLPISKAADQGAEHAALAAAQGRAADDRGGDRVELEEQAGAAADGSADPRRERDAGDAVGDAGQDEVPEHDGLRSMPESRAASGLLPTA